MKKLRTVLSLALVLVCATIAPAFAAAPYDVKNPDGTRDYFDSTGTKSATCKKPDYIVYYVEVDADGYDNRSWAIGSVKEGVYNVAYYQDPSGQLWTDMPQYGGTKVNAIGDANDANAFKYTYDEVQQYVHPSVTVNKTPVGFYDIPDNAWFAEAVNVLANNGVLQGDGQGHFYPYGVMTWQHVYYVMFGILGMDLNLTPQTYRDDVPVSFESKAGVVNRILGIYQPDDLGRPVTRAEAAYVITAFYGISKNMTPNNGFLDLKYTQEHCADKAVANGAKRWTLAEIPDGQLATSLIKEIRGFSDKMDIAMIENAYTLGIVHGVDAIGTMNAAGSLTRAEFCQMLYNAGFIGYTGYTYIYTMSTLDLYNYMNSHYTDGTLVEGYEPVNGGLSF